MSLNINNLQKILLSLIDLIGFIAAPGYLPMKPILDSSVCNTGDVAGIVNNPGYVARGEVNILKPTFVGVNL